jgi:AAA15 family ATPase/GTPase
VRSIWLQDFLSFNASPALWLGPGLTVITGPNGAGKSNLARSLDVARAVLAPHDHPESGRLDLYREAGGGLRGRRGVHGQGGYGS